MNVHPAPEVRIVAEMQIHDYLAASEDAKNLLEQSPNNHTAWLSYIEASASSGQEQKFLLAGQEYLKRFPDSPLQKRILETVAWGIIKNASNSSSQLVRLYAMIAAYFTQDANAVKILSKMLQDPCPQIRAISAKLAADYRDDLLKEQIRHRIDFEKQSFVRNELIYAVGKMKIRALKNVLEGMLSDENLPVDEKEAAVEALTMLIESKEHLPIQQLTLSKRMILRKMAAASILDSLDKKKGPLLFPLLRDPVSDVRKAAVQTLASLQIESDFVKESFKVLMDDPDPYVAISAGWGLMSYDSENSIKAFEKWLNHPDAKWRTFAAGALAATGPACADRMIKALKNTTDPFVQVNLARGLVIQRQGLQAACDALCSFIEETKEHAIWEDDGPIRYLISSSQAPEHSMWNQSVGRDFIARLEILHLLLLADDPRAVLFLKKMLKTKSLHAIGIASSLLLSEADDEAASVVFALLEDDDIEIRVQAALLLALWGKGEAGSLDGSMTELLQNAYPTADRQMKEQILEGLGRLGKEDSIPFLLSLVQTPSQTLRILVASSLILCLSG